MAKNLNTAASSAPAVKAPRKSRAKPAAAIISVNHAETIEPTDDFTALLAELGAAPDTLIEPADSFNDADVGALAEAVGSAEATEIMMASAGVEEFDADTAPTDGAVAADAPVEAPVGKTKKVAAPRVHYSDKVERLQAVIGDKLGEYVVLETADALLDEAELAVTIAKTLDIIRAMNVKEKNRASNFIEFLSGKKAKLNHVLGRVIALLERDGFVTTGNEGNLFKDLVAHPYTPASARAMGGNTVGMFADLKVILADGKGKFSPNPDSLLLMKAKSLLSAPAPVAAAEPEVEPVTAEEDAADELGAEIDTLEALLAA